MEFAICPLNAICLMARYVPSGRERGNLYHIATETKCRLYRICKVNISHEQSEYIAKGVLNMSDKTIKELAIELTVEITNICDNIKGRSVFVNQLLRSCSSIGA